MKVQPPSNDTLWGWFGWTVAGVWIALIEGLRRAQKARKELRARVEEQGKLIASHIEECGRYRRAQVESQQKEEQRQSDRHRENSARLERIEALLMTRARGH